ncbi:MAG: exodeoxyribonuclease V subunit alpha [Verrucomicrobia bacterium]|nr:exodeoxyribonuclease V subunit alpha [Verrucomicrobiota bacterium]MDA1065659.1 exodeoxyribonuclease V subunit alpha [Verrucomicrobiota bacterium]
MSTIDNIPQLNTLDRALGHLIDRKSESNDSNLGIVAALVSYALRQGHVCQDLNELKNGDFSEYFDPEFLEAPITHLETKDLVGSETESSQPLILTSKGKLYLHRYWHYEQYLLTILEERFRSPLSPIKQKEFANFLDSNASLGADQKAAITLAIQSQLTLISGGPGTGKTTTVLYILAFLMAQERVTPLRIGLAAPTGKAAQRIQNSLESGIQNLYLSSEEKAKIPTEASTLHRLLGYQKNSTEFKHNRKTPLPFDVVIVDEASMLDLLMFSKLLEALKPTSKLILLGDRHQLASVEAGSIFGDLIQASVSNKALALRVIELNQNFRFGNDSPLFLACEAIKEGNSAETLSIVEPGNNELRLLPLPAPQKLSQALESSVTSHFINVSMAESPEEALKLVEHQTILTPIRNGSFGVERLNMAIESLIRSKFKIPPHTTYFSGQPILITENSYSQRLFNGDLGILFASPDRPDDLFAYFKDSKEEELKRFPISVLPNFELAYALTVHKSQGSEYIKVTFIIPPGKSPLLTRELIYTAISRSRESVEIWGSKEDLSLAIESQTIRTSGILDAMSG